MSREALVGLLPDETNSFMDNVNVAAVTYHQSATYFQNLADRQINSLDFP